MCACVCVFARVRVNMRTANHLSHFSFLRIRVALGRHVANRLTERDATQSTAHQGDQKKQKQKQRQKQNKRNTKTYQQKRQRIAICDAHLRAAGGKKNTASHKTNASQSTPARLSPDVDLIIELGVHDHRRVGKRRIEHREHANSDER